MVITLMEILRDKQIQLFNSPSLTLKFKLLTLQMYEALKISHFERICKSATQFCETHFMIHFLFFY